MSTHIGVIGTGYISRFHFKAFQTLGTKVVRVADIDLASAQAAAAPFGAAVSTEWQDVVNDPNVDTVAIFSPTPLHAAIARAALQAGKHVICEKTLTLSAADSLALAKLAETQKRMLYTSYMKRFFPAVKKAKELVAGLGRIVSVYCRTYQGVAPHNLYTGKLEAPFGLDADGSSRIMKTAGGGILECGGSHLADMLIHLVGMPSSVYARQLRRDGSDLDLITHAMFGYDDGNTAHCECNWHPLSKIGYQGSGWDEGFEITGETGRILLETPVWNEPERNAPRLRHYDNATGNWTDYQTDIVCPFTEAERYFASRLAAGSHETWYDRLVGYRVDLLLEKTSESAASGHVVLMGAQ